ncbi:DUF11 domain-containing protein [Mycetocola lacteus]|uniref:DUF11 domain-containing protein n=2 Tax=Mycetocola lacteus TaxID=76637 RepID=A0A3L7AIV4_9MICO|nr:DUF11 domain-containing protein [Mycetocola lacteus]
MLGRKRRYLARHKTVQSRGFTPWSRTMAIVATGVSALLVAGSLGTLPALAAGDQKPQYLGVEKSVNAGAGDQKSVSLKPGDEFTYQIRVTCDEGDCTDAVLTDNLPAGLAGFEVLEVGTTDAKVTLTGVKPGQVLGTAETLTGTFGFPIPSGGTGLPDQGSVIISLKLRVPANLSPDWAFNGTAIQNTARATSTTARDVNSSASITVGIEKKTGIATTKTWAPANQQFKPGDTSTITLGAGNTGNVGANQLTLQDPSGAVDGAPALAADNPFSIVDFQGFGPVTLAQGATQVAVDAYVFDGTSWKWVTGVPGPASAIALPSGVSASDVGGIRIRQIGADGSIVAGGSAGTIALQVAQRETTRTATPTSLVGGAKLTNKAAGTVTYPDLDPVTTTATAPFEIGGLNVSVGAGKTIDPSKIPAGGTARAHVTGANTSNGPLSTLVLSDLDYFSQSLAFGGFSEGITYPQGATAATVTWVYDDTSTEVVPFASGETPAVPAGKVVTGFILTYTGAIAKDAQTAADYLIKPAVDYVNAETGKVSTKNNLKVTGKNAAGESSQNASAPLDIHFPKVDLDLKKTVTPGYPVEPGALVTTALEATTRTGTELVPSTTIVITDEWTTGDKTTNFWEAHNPVRVAPTVIPANTSLTVEYKDASGVWHVLDGTPTASVPKAGNFSADLPRDAVGVRYSFSNPDGFAQGVILKPYTTFEARETLRGTDNIPTAVPATNPKPSTYTNTATTKATAERPGLPTITSDTKKSQATAQIQIRTDDGSGIPGPLVSKGWFDVTKTNNKVGILNAQSSDHVLTKLGWGVTRTGFSSVTLNEPNGGENTPESTVFQAFDLVGIGAVSRADDPALHWDRVSTVELFNGTAWTEVKPAGGSWMNAAGFIGYQLTDAERASTTGLRITVVPDVDARTKSTDPLAPPVNSGITTSGGVTASRIIPVEWKLRNVLRVIPADNPDKRWVDERAPFNLPATGSIRNTLGVTGVYDGQNISGSAFADISLANQPPGVKVFKDASAASVVLPNLAEVPEGKFPVVTYRVAAINNSTAAASFIRVTDPTMCTLDNCITDSQRPDSVMFGTKASDYDPATNPFELMNLRKLTFTLPAGQVDINASTVQLWKRDAAGTLSVETVSVAQAGALSAAALADVVGVSVLYQGTNPKQDGGSMLTGTLDPKNIASSKNVLLMSVETQVRAHDRSTGALVTPASVDRSVVANTSTAQSYDPVLYPSKAGTDAASAEVKLLDGELRVSATKKIAPAALTEVKKGDPVTLTLGAASKDKAGVESTVSSRKVVIEDTTDAFWNAYALQRLVPNQIMKPNGADRVQVDIRTGLGADAVWHLGTPAAAAALPADVSDPQTASGIRFTFTNSTGRSFSTTAPPATWNASAVLNLALRTQTLDGQAIDFAKKNTITNTATVESSYNYAPGTPVVYSPATDKSQAPIETGPGRHSLSLSKTPAQQIVRVDDVNLWTLSFTNSNESYLNITQVEDRLPEFLKWDEENPTFATSANGLLSTQVKTAFDPETRKITFTWPSDKNRMAPGEKFTITLNLALQAGLPQGGQATNALVVTTVQDLDSCSRGTNQGTVDGLAPNQCGTTNFVKQQAGALFQISKSVKGELADPDKKLTSGATNRVSADRVCAPDAEGYYGADCVANTVVGATDGWKLRMVNTGDTSLTTATILDILPFAGDKNLVAGDSRGSTYRPMFDGDFGVKLRDGAPVGTTMSWEITTDPRARVCVGDGTGWKDDPTCKSATWRMMTAGTVLSDAEATAVSAIRVTLDFSRVLGGLAPGKEAGVGFQTINVPDSADHVGGAHVDLSGASRVADVAINQPAAQGVFAGGQTQSRASKSVGVRIATGVLPLAKNFTGEAAKYAPGGASADVSCRVPSGRNDATGRAQLMPLKLADTGKVLFTNTNRFATVFTGLPLGALCDVSESGDRGLFGETDRSGGVKNIQIVAGAASALPTVALENRYDMTSLKVTKKIDTLADPAIFANFSFDFALSCTAAVSKIPVTWDGEEVLKFSLTPGDGENAELSREVTGIPVGATCELTETDTRGAQHTTVSLNGQTISETDAAAPTEPVATPSAVFTAAAADPLKEFEVANNIEVTNRFDTGRLSIFKELAGAGKDTYGQAEGTHLTAAVTCTYGTSPVQTLFEDTVAITAGEATEIERDFPLGTACEITEVNTGGATHTDNPESGSVIITGSAVTADITNHFDVGSLEIVKERTGSGVDAFGQGTYTAAVVCTWQRDGDTLTAPLVNGGIVTLGPDNNYRAELTGILIGAHCTVTETDAGLATAVSYAPEDGTVTITDPESTQDTARVTITNTFTTGSLEIRKSVQAPLAVTNGEVTYTIDVTNTGEIEATDVPVTDVLPTGATFLNAPKGTFANGEVRWNLEKLAPGESVSLSVTVAFAQPGKFENCASLVKPNGPWSDTVVHNPGADKNASCVSVTVVPGNPNTPPSGDNTVIPGLPNTGSDVRGIIGGTLLLLLAGAAVIWLARRERFSNAA